jgi:hypothetical protein
MLAPLDILQTRLGGRPLLLFAAILVLLVAGRRRISLRQTAPAWMQRAELLVALVGGLALLAYPAIALWYASDAHFFDNAEPTMPAVAWLFHAGKPLYHLPDSAERYAHIYGPMAFIAHSWVQAALGPGLRISKGLGAASGLASLLFLFGAMRRHGSAARTAALTGVGALLLLTFRHYSFWTRPDSLQLLSVSAALFFAVTATSARGDLSAALVGLASGLLWNMKLTGPLYSLPVFALLHRRTGWRGTFIALAAGIATAVAPFVLLSNVSLVNYLAWLRLSAHTGLLLSLLRQNIEWAIYLGLPLLLSYYAVPPEHRSRGTEWRNLMVALLTGVCGVVIAAAKPGAGPYHLIPFVPIIMYAVSRQAARFSSSTALDPVLPRASIAFLLVAVMIALGQQALLISTMSARRAIGDADDITRFADAHQGVIEMGYGTTESLSFARPILVFRNNSYLLDQPAVREHQLAGVELPQATVDALASCSVRYWLIPKGEAPFSGVNGYPAVFLRPLYSDDFRRAFDATYRRVSTTTYYDVWECPGQ